MITVQFIQTSGEKHTVADKKNAYKRSRLTSTKYSYNKLRSTWDRSQRIKLKKTAQIKLKETRRLNVSRYSRIYRSVRYEHNFMTNSFFSSLSFTRTIQKSRLSSFVLVYFINANSVCPCNANNNQIQ